MIERIGTAGYEDISWPNRITVEGVRHAAERTNWQCSVAEIGVGIGATTLEIAKLLDNRGELHLFDFEDRVSELQRDLNQLGFTNVQVFGNSHAHWDSYHWSLARFLDTGLREIYDYIYLDGVHTLLHDGLTFFICDRLLKVGGVIDFDDYGWRLKEASEMKNVRHDFMTAEQIDAYQIKMVVDLFVKTNPAYSEVVENKVYRKSRATGRAARRNHPTPLLGERRGRRQRWTPPSRAEDACLGNREPQVLLWR